MAERVVLSAGKGKVEVKRSRFLGELYPVRSGEEAEAKVRAVEKTYYSARHHCFAYILSSGESRASDDGEPKGTAGRPLLSVLKSGGILDAVLIVTRYFGGILLGTGGLVRAYTKAGEAAAEDALLAERKEGIRLIFTSSYEKDGETAYLIRQTGGEVLQKDYAAKVRTDCVFSPAGADEFTARLKELTGGQIQAERERVFFAHAEGKTILLP